MAFENGQKSLKTRRKYDSSWVWSVINDLLFETSPNWPLLSQSSSRTMSLGYGATNRPWQFRCSRRQSVTIQNWSHQTSRNPLNSKPTRPPSRWEQPYSSWMNAERNAWWELLPVHSRKPRETTTFGIENLWASFMASSTGGTYSQALPYQCKSLSTTQI